MLAKQFTEAEDAANKVERQVVESAAATLVESTINWPVQRVFLHLRHNLRIRELVRASTATMLY